MVRRLRKKNPIRLVMADAQVELAVPCPSRAPSIGAPALSHYFILVLLLAQLVTSRFRSSRGHSYKFLAGSWSAYLTGYTGAFCSGWRPVTLFI